MKAVRTSIFLALVAIAAFASIVHAYPMNAFDTKKGAYTTVQVAVAGSYINGKIYNPAAYVKVVIDKDLPSPYCLVVYYYFEWEDLNHVVHYQYDTVDCPGYTTAGQWVRFFATGLPSQVYYIVAEGRAGYDGVWDTDMASISIPFL